MAFYFQPKPGEIEKLVRSFRPTDRKMAALGVFLYQQVKKRFATGGSSGGKPWDGKWLKAVGADDHRAVLTGPTGHLLMSFFSDSGKDWAEVASDLPYSLPMQVGQQGKGGVLPDTKPKHAKALFVPITDRAAKSIRLHGPTAGYVRQKGHQPYSEAPIRAFEKKMPGGLYTLVPLVKGRLHEGRLQKWSNVQQGYVDGKPDFIFLSKTSSPPRPMLPDGQQEQADQDQFILDLLMGNAPKP